jgi:hypothetical protein
LGGGSIVAFTSTDDRSVKFSNSVDRAGVRKLPACNKFHSLQTKTFDALNFLCAYILTFAAGELPALSRTVMRNARKYIAGIAANVRPLTRLADWSCMSVMTRGPHFQLEAGLIRQARM